MPRFQLVTCSALLLICCASTASEAAARPDAARTPGAAKESLLDAPLPSAAFMVTAEGGAALVDALSAHDYATAPATAPIATFKSHPPLRVEAFYNPRPVGDFKEWIAAHSDKAVSKLDRYVVAEFSSIATRNAALAAAASDAQLSLAHAIFVLGGEGFRTSLADLAQGSASQPQHSLLRIIEASQLSPGWALIGNADSGIAGDHPALRSRAANDSNGGQLVPGGPFLPHYSANVGSLSQNRDDVREVQPQDVEFPTEILCDGADGSTDGKLNNPSAGHGTHVAGLLATNQGVAGHAAQGACAGCSIAVARVSRLACNYEPSNPYVNLIIDTATTSKGLSHLVLAGAQVVNLSLGAPHTAQNPMPICDPSEPGPAVEDMFCMQLRAAAQSDVVIGAASGNHRSSALDFPARDPRTIAVGGLHAPIGALPTLWDWSPDGTLESCPYSNLTTGYVNPRSCGSNWSTYVPFDPLRREEFRQELVAPAVSLYSTIHPSGLWNSKLSCGDAFGDADANNGYGACTGTSMATPIISGIAALLRSINPLVPVGDPFSSGASPGGVRDALADTASRASEGQGWDSRVGFGYPDAARAATLLLGRTSGVVARNRATPLFRLYSHANSDYAHVTSPQMALSLMQFQADNYSSESPTADGGMFIAGGPIPAYSLLPGGVASPRSTAYVLATADLPGYATRPLFLLDRCPRSGGTACRGTRDLVLATDTAAVNAALASGYAYAGRQGFVIAPCSPEPQCMPPHAQPLRVQCSAARTDCTAFIESEAAIFESIGGGSYTEPFFGAPRTIGYAFPAIDSDGDGLVDGFESVLGTSPTAADSDADGMPDGKELPLAGIPISDPCDGPGPITCPRAFASGFEEY